MIVSYVSVRQSETQFSRTFFLCSFQGYQKGRGDANRVCFWCGGLRFPKVEETEAKMWSEQEVEVLNSGGEAVNWSGSGSSARTVCLSGTLAEFSAANRWFVGRGKALLKKKGIQLVVIGSGAPTLLLVS